MRTLVRRDQLKWIAFPQNGNANGSVAHIKLADGIERDGWVTKLMPRLSDAGRMAQVLINVPDPTLLDNPCCREAALLLDQVVNVEIDGAQVDGVLRIPRTALRDGSRLWMLSQDNKLLFHTVTTIWGTRDAAYINNHLPPGARLITSNLGAPIEQMSLAVEGESVLNKEHAEETDKTRGDHE